MEVERVLLDASALIELLQNGSKQKKVFTYCEGKEIEISTLTVFETLLGVSNQKNVWNMISQIQNTVFDTKTAILSANLQQQLLQKGKPLSKFDCLIAGTAIAQNIPLLTCDKDFKNVPGLKAIVI